MKYLLSAILILSFVSVSAQTDTTKKKASNKIYYYGEFITRGEVDYQILAGNKFSATNVNKELYGMWHVNEFKKLITFDYTLDEPVTYKIEKVEQRKNCRRYYASTVLTNVWIDVDDNNYIVIYRDNGSTKSMLHIIDKGWGYVNGNNELVKVIKQRHLE